MANTQGPEPGFPLKIEEAELMYQELEQRMENFPDESLHDSFMVVILNTGDRYTPVTCIGGEWTGLKGDISGSAPDVPTCPEGHPLTEGFGYSLGWVNDSSTLSMAAANVTDVVGDAMQPLPPPVPLPEET